MINTKTPLFKSFTFSNSLDAHNLVDFQFVSSSLEVSIPNGFSTLGTNGMNIVYSNTRFENASLTTLMVPNPSTGDLYTIPGAFIAAVKDKVSQKRIVFLSFTNLDAQVNEYIEHVKNGLLYCMLSFLNKETREINCDLIYTVSFPNVNSIEPYIPSLGNFVYNDSSLPKTINLYFKEVTHNTNSVIFSSMPNSKGISEESTSSLSANMNYVCRYIGKSSKENLTTNLNIREKPIYENLVFSDEFTGDTLDMSKWNYEVPMSTRNNEKQTYTSDGSNILVENGVLKIQAKKDNSGNITSASLHTIGMETFQYGRIEMRAKIPANTGTWPAFWLQGQKPENMSHFSNWPFTGEVDILEVIDGDGDSHFNIWTPNPDATVVAHSYTTEHTNVNICDGEYHTFGIVWTETQMAWYVDDVIRYVVDISNSAYDCYRTYPQYLILNLAIEGNWPSTKFTDNLAEYVIDYVRVYQ